MLPFVKNRAGIFLRSCALRTYSACLCAGLFSITAGLGQAAPKPWSAIGPEGGDARSFAAIPGDPAHLFLGTTNSWIYESTNGGVSWHRLAKLEASDDLVIDHIVVDSTNPSTLYAAAWTLGHPGGGLWVSHDAGKSWNQSDGLSGQSIRAFVQARSSPAVLFAGTLEGVFRSSDGSATWEQISPKGSTEIHEVESLAVDPGNPDIVYAGTWHLPWKTTDGGQNWHAIKKGMIDDSDVFSIVVDPEKPNVVYASACSGIYKSHTAGELFRKIQGIPATARRTRVLRQDPEHSEVLYAGTTEGLYKTTDAGKTFKRMTAPDVIVNDVNIDSADPSHVLLATDRGGVLASHDGFATFVPSNAGISERKVDALMVDGRNPDRIFAGVVNDKAYGSVFVSSGGGAQWKQVADGLDGRDVFAIAQSPEGTILVGTNSGIFALDPDAPAWQPRNLITYAPDAKTASASVEKTAVNGKNRLRAKLQSMDKPHANDPSHEIDGRVFALDLSGDAWLASTSGGLYTSKDKGATWQGGPVMGVAGYLSAAAHGSVMAAVRPNAVVVSEDDGRNWWPVSIPIALTRIHRVAFSPDGTLWIGGREGVYFSRDGGKSWMWVHRLPLVDIDDLYYDAQLDRVLVSSRGSDFVYAIDAKTLDWKWWQTGYKLAAVRVAGGRLLAASLEDGVLMEPRVDGTEIGQR
jgi:photosystem II stability/assembly factor-like uncharacterized protein